MYKYSNTFLVYYKHKLRFCLFFIVLILIIRKKKLSHDNTSKSYAFYLHKKINILNLE